MKPERWLATVLFTDIVGSTERAAELGDRAWRQLLETHHALARREIAHHKGRELNMTGDGFLATFDAPERALSCACAIRAAVRRIGIEIRGGLHTGEVELVGNNVGGIAVHIAARVLTAAAPGEIVVSSTLRVEVQRAERRELRRQAGGAELVDAFGPLEVLEPVLAQVAQARVAGEGVERQRPGSRGEQHLTPVRGAEDACHAVERRAEEVPVALLGRTHVHRHPHPQGRLARRLRGCIAGL